jgi:hypothetical protein
MEQKGIITRLGKWSIIFVYPFSGSQPVESPNSALKDYLLCLFDPQMAPMAVKVALMVGSILFVINHGSALLGGTMTPGRWSSALLTYVVPYGVNIHGQYSARRRWFK